MGNIPDSSQRIARNTSYPTVFFADTVTVGTTITQVYNVNKSGWITIKAHADNAASVTVGTSAITASDGYVLAAGEEVTIEHNKLSDIYAIHGDQSDIYVHIIGSYQDN
jgi:hypothetical protein